jgi:hypothetical protein
MTQKDKIVAFMEGKDKVHLRDICALEGLKAPSVRGIINHDVKLGITFERLGKGFYKLQASQAAQTDVK